MYGFGRVTGIGLALMMACTLSGSVAQAQTDADRAAARELGAQGLTAYHAGDYATALVKLDKAHALVPAPSLKLWQARALAKQGQLLAASERYLAAIRMQLGSGDVSVQRKAQEDAAREREELLQRIPAMTIVLEGATSSEVAVSVDGQPLAAALIGESMPANPGQHVVVGVRGQESVELNVKLKEGERQTALLKFAATGSAPVTAPPPSTTAPVPPRAKASPPAAGPVKAAATTLQPPPPDNVLRTAGFVAIGVGAASIGVGAVTGAVLLGRKGDLESGEGCREYRCAPSKQDDVSSFNTLRTVSSVGFIAGGVLAAAGIGLILTHGKADSQIALVVAPNSFRARGAF